MNYHYIIVGAGAAGCVLASRLTEDPSINVLVLEAGHERRTPLLSVPAGEVVLMGNPNYDWCFETEPDPTLSGRRLRIPRGRLLGGSNAINGMIYVRGQRIDYDTWAQRGNQGWSYADVLPYFKRLERFSGYGNEGRGRDGPVHVTTPRERDELCDAFLCAATSVGYALNTDYNGDRQDGFGYYQVTQKEGRRWSVVDAYLKQARLRPNLTVVTEARVTRVSFSGHRCIGVSYLRRGHQLDVRSDGEVILSAGVVQSPQILELSGIGSEVVLRAAKVHVLKHLPGVGENLRDHFAVRMKWRVKKPVTFNERTRGLPLLREIGRYLVARRGLLSLPIALGHGFIRSSPAVEEPDIQFHFAPASYGPSSCRRLDNKPGMTLGVYPLRPESTGSIHIHSNDPFDPPAIRSRFLSSEVDQACLVAGMRAARRIVESTTMDDYRDHELAPGSQRASDADLLAYARDHGDTSYHPVGTCRMGHDALAVVDDRLRVHGFSGLRVIDASVMPTMVSGNTNAATLMIAEKGAAMILEDRIAALREAA